MMPSPGTICEILMARAEAEPDRLSHAFIEDRGRRTDTLSYGQLCERVERVAAFLLRSSARQEPVACIFGPGIDFVTAFLGCLWAGRIGVPIAPARRGEGHEAIDQVLRDCGARIVLTNIEALGAAQAVGSSQDLAWIDIATLPVGERALLEARPQDIAWLQYTSGSTGRPKGVIVGHDNLMANSRVIETAFGHTRDSIAVMWAPPHHDMGLVGGLVQPLFVGFPVYLMSPIDVIRSPGAWLRAISKHRATASGGPNFAYEMCVARVREEALAELDLSSWSVAFCGAEPVSMATLQRFADKFSACGFRPGAFLPCYGLAEATLMVSGAHRRDGPSVAAIEDRAAVALDYVSCGKPTAAHEVRIVDPDSGKPLAARQVGEIWVRGPSIARGYWDDADLTARTFVNADDEDAPFLRTGDLGFLSSDGDLHVCGRLRSIFIAHGVNHSLEDLERTASLAHPALGAQQCLAMPIGAPGEERLVLLQEAPPSARQPPLAQDVMETIREQLVQRHGLNPAAIKLVPIGAVPRTRSGKPRRDRSLYPELSASG
jgi:acyl-CoA synthetase (AMP-forming)/AMP-acid ligase II